jgi:GT2 family glycosyltransferase
VEVAPDTVSALVNRLQPDLDTPETEIAAVCPLLVDADGRPASRIHEIPTKDELKAAARGEALPPTNLDLAAESVAVAYPELDAVLIRKVFVRSMHYFDERFGNYWADADLAMQIRRAGRQIRLFPAIRDLSCRARSAGRRCFARADRIGGAAALLANTKAGAAFSLKLGVILAALARFDSDWSASWRAARSWMARKLFKLKRFPDPLRLIGTLPYPNLLPIPRR